ncbi:MAG: M56 family metallopeptidase [Bryobacteraceae bacterium]
MEISLTVLSHLADVSVRAVFLLVLASAALLLGRGKSASVRHGAWTLVMAGMILVAILNPLLPPLPLRVLPVEASIASPEVGTGELTQYVVPSKPGSPVAAAASVPRRRTASWPQVLLYAYAAGVLISLSRLLYGYLFVRRLVSRGRPVERAWILPCLNRLPAGRRVELLESEWISVPVTTGWTHPKILLPSEWGGWSDTKTEAVLTHELCHVQRADWLVALLAGLNRSIFWFHPQAWWLERKLTSLAEEACDDDSLLYFEDREQYAQALIDMAAAIRLGQGRLLWEAMAMARQSHVRARVERVLDRARRISRGLTPGRWAAVLACSLPFVLLASALQPGPAETQAKTPWLTIPAGGERLRLSVEAWGLKPDDVKKLEQRLEANPEDLNARALLISRYFQYAEREPLLRHVFWVIEHHPESDLVGFFMISPRPSPLNDEADFDRARALWLQQTARYPNDARVLANAARCLSQSRFNGSLSLALPYDLASTLQTPRRVFPSQRQSDFDEAEWLLKRARALEPDRPEWTLQLAQLYAGVITATAVNTGNTTWKLSPGMEDEQFAARARAELESSTDWALLASVGDILTRRLRFAADRPEYPFPWKDSAELKALAEFGERLLKQAEQSGTQR